MTTIVWKDGVLAADGRASTSNRIASDKVRKIVMLPGAVLRGSPVICFALAGAADMQHRVGEWIREGCPVDLEHHFDGTEFGCIIVTEAEAYIYADDFGDIMPLGDEVLECLGSGGSFATSVSYLGYNAIKCVKHAARIDIFTGGTGTYIDCRAKGDLYLKEFAVE